MFICAVIDDELQTKQCLNLSVDVNIKSPIELESTIKGDGFICQEDLKSLYTFSCTIHNSDLIWVFNDTIVTAFLEDDQAGRIFSMTYPQISPVYNVTAVLTQVQLPNIYNTTYCVSVLTVQPLNGIEVEIIPFTVSCQTFCKNSTPVCQTKHYEVAGRL